MPEAGKWHHLLCFLWIYLWPGFLRAREQIGGTLIACRLTYPFPQLDVQPCAVDGKCLSEGHRLGMQLAGCAPVLYCWPSYLWAAVEYGRVHSLERPADSARCRAPRPPISHLALDSAAAWSQTPGGCLHSWRETRLIVYLPRWVLMVGTSEWSPGASSWGR